MQQMRTIFGKEHHKPWHGWLWQRNRPETACGAPVATGFAGFDRLTWGVAAGAGWCALSVVGGGWGASHTLMLSVEVYLKLHLF